MRKEETMKRTISILFALALVLALSLVAVPSGPALASPGNLYVDDDATADCTVSSYSDTILRLWATSACFAGYDSGDAVEFVSGTGDRWVTTIKTKHTDARVTLQTAWGGDFTDGTFNIVDLDAPSVGDPFRYIQSAITIASSSDTINVAAGTYVETGQIVINKNLTIVGADKTTTIIKPAQNTGGSGDARGWFLVTAGNQFNLSNLTLDGAGWNVHQAIRSLGSGTINNNIIKNIRYSQYFGLGMVVMGNYDMTFSNNTFTNIERIGMMAYGSGVTNAQMIGNTYTGKGAGDWLDYGIEIGGGAIATITGNTITNCGISTSGWASAGILVSTYYGAGTAATITGNTLTGNEYGIAIGYDAGDTSVVTAHFNNISGNTDGVDTTSGTVTTDATYNWWGDNSGPGGVGPGTGDTVSANVNYDSWTTEKTTSTGTGTASVTPSAGNITGLSAVAEGSLPLAAQATKPISFPDGLFSFNITGLTPGQTVTVTITLPPGAAPTQYWKYHASEGGWIQIPMTVVGPPNVIRITLVDGGLGDDDLTPNGTIVDQGGPGTGAVGWETYPISKVRVFLPWIALLAAIVAGASLLVVRRRRAQS